MNKFAIAVHGGAGPDSEHIKNNKPAIEQGLRDAATAGLEYLRRGATATDAVERAIAVLEDNPVFNAGRGSVLNTKGQVEMDASLMDGRTLRAGAVAGVQMLRNPIKVARMVMDKTEHVLLCGKPAIEFGSKMKAKLESVAYFITEDRYKEFIEQKQESSMELLHKKVHGTVGAVALDQYGNIAAGASTGGTANSLPGRIGDSCLIGAGCYANNNTCAVSGTGDGELLIRGVIAHSVSSVIEYTRCKLQDACDFIVLKKNKGVDGDIGVITVNKAGDFGMTFNSKTMPRAWATNSHQLKVQIY
jgi:beta-aspartyl-peptidase (threonine type)